MDNTVHFVFVHFESKLLDPVLNYNYLKKNINIYFFLLTYSWRKTHDRKAIGTPWEQWFSSFAFTNSFPHKFKVDVTF